MHLHARSTLQRASLSRPARSPFDELTPRELEIAKALAAGETMRAITERLEISPKTASTHKYRIYDKLCVSSEVALIALARQHGLC